MIAQRQPQPQQLPGARVGAGVIVLWLVLLVPPALALPRVARELDLRILLPALIGINVVTYFLYARDKRRAQAGAWRIAETTLHLVALLGGWPAAFLAQRRFRHKISKTSFQVAYWLIVALHESATMDYLQGWRWSQAIRDAW